MFGIFAIDHGRKRPALDGKEFSSLNDAVDFVKANVNGLVHIELDEDNEAADYFAHGSIYAIERING